LGKCALQKRLFFDIVLYDGRNGFHTFKFIVFHPNNYREPHQPERFVLAGVTSARADTDDFCAKITNCYK
jgi:hypothetical protein